MRGQVIYREKDEFEEEEEVKIKKGGRVERLVAARKGELEKIYAVTPFPLASHLSFEADALQDCRMQKRFRALVVQFSQRSKRNREIPNSWLKPPRRRTSTGSRESESKVMACTPYGLIE